MDTVAQVNRLTPERRFALFQNLFRLSRPQIANQQFYQAFFGTLIEVFQATEVCVWAAQSGKFSIVFATNIERIGLIPDSAEWTAHHQILASCAMQKAPLRVGPRQTETAWANPLTFELLLVPVMTGFMMEGIVEILRAVPPESADFGDAAAISAQLTELQQWSEFLRDYLQGRSLGALASKSESEAALRLFGARLYEAQSRQEVALIAVNEGRQTIGCERVAVGWSDDRGTAILAVSGLESVNSRSNVVQTLLQLTKSAIQSGRPLNYRFVPTEENSKPNTSNVDQAYHAALESYPVGERPKHVLVIPMVDTSPNKEQPSPSRGALIIEQFRAEQVLPFMQQRALIVAEQVRIALTRSELVDERHLFAFWKRIAKGGRTRFLRQIFWTVSIAAVVIALAVVPIEMRLAADGELLCESRRTVFAAEDGIVREVLLRHGDTLDQGQKVVLLENFELVARHRDLTGQLLQTREKIRSQDARRIGTKVTAREQDEIQAAMAESMVVATHLESQIQRTQEQLDRLIVKTPEAGIVTSWNLEQSLLHRPFRQGDALFEVINPSGTWILELRILEDRSGYVSRRIDQLKSDQKMTVDFVLATQPETRFSGQIRELAPRTNMTTEGHTVLAIVDLDPARRPPLRDGAEVKARLNCGQRAIGFVLFREIIEIIYTYIWY